MPIAWTSSKETSLTFHAALTTFTIQRASIQHRFLCFLCLFILFLVTTCKSTKRNRTTGSNRKWVFLRTSSPTSLLFMLWVSFGWLLSSRPWHCEWCKDIKDLAWSEYWTSPSITFAYSKMREADVGDSFLYCFTRLCFSSLLLSASFSRPTRLSPRNRHS